MNENIIKDEALTKFVDELVTACKTHADWLTIIKFGLPTLMENQSLLFRLIMDESDTIRSDWSGDTQTILSELKLHLEITQ